MKRDIKNIILIVLGLTVGCFAVNAQEIDEKKIDKIVERIQQMKVEAINNQYQLKVFYGTEKKLETGKVQITEFVGLITSLNYTVVQKTSLNEGYSQNEEYYYDTDGQLIAYIFQNSPTLNTVFLIEKNNIIVAFEDEIVNTPFGQMEVITLTAPLKTQYLLASKDAKKIYNSLEKLKE